MQNTWQWHFYCLNRLTISTFQPWCDALLENVPELLHERFKFGEEQTHFEHAALATLYIAPKSRSIQNPILHQVVLNIKLRTSNAINRLNVLQLGYENET